MVTVWHGGSEVAGCRATSRVTRRTRHVAGGGARNNARVTFLRTSPRWLSGGTLVSPLHRSPAATLAEGRYRTREDDGAEAADAHREREGDEEHHATWKRPQVVGEPPLKSPCRNAGCALLLANFTSLFRIVARIRDENFLEAREISKPAKIS